MADQGKVERRVAVMDRRIGEADRRQYFDLSWPIEKERRLASEDRRHGPADRRGI